jgi:hypothetical protein
MSHNFRRRARSTGHVGLGDTCDLNLAGYIVYYGYASGHYEAAVDVGMQTTTTFLDLAEAQAYYFAVAS